MKRIQLVMMLVSMGCLAALATDIYLPAMGDIATALATHMQQVQITLALFFATFALGQLIYGPLSDHYGRRTTLLFGIALFGTAALFCAQTNSVQGLMLGRFLLGLGACAGVVSCYAICRDCYSGVELSKTLALISAAIGIAPMLAPLLGAGLNDAFGWQSIFYFLAGFAALLFIWILFALDETNPNNLSAQPSSARLSYWKMLTDRQFFPYLLANCCAFIALFAYIGSSPIILMQQWGLSQYQFSIFFAINAGCMILGNSLLSIALNLISSQKVLKIAYSLIIGASTFMFLIAPISHFLIAPDKLVRAQVLLFCVAMGLVSMAVVVVLSITMGSLLQRFGQQAGKAAALAGCSRFSAGFVIIMLISQLQLASLNSLAAIILLCGIGCLLASYLAHKQPGLGANSQTA
ncbi:MAG: multidrug effflux MFS transporter [Pseudomonadales bacterium]|nr:multidrug effflux MFS transporter [Pseudomonadales bacterium]